MKCEQEFLIFYIMILMLLTNTLQAKKNSKGALNHRIETDFV